MTSAKVAAEAQALTLQRNYTEMRAMSDFNQKRLSEASKEHLQQLEELMSSKQQVTGLNLLPQ